MGSHVAFNKMIESADLDSTVVLTHLHTPDSNLGDFTRTSTMIYEGEGIFFGKKRMDFAISLTGATSSFDEKIHKLRRRVHAEFMREHASQAGDFSCEGLISTKRLLMANIFEVFNLPFENSIDEHESVSVDNIYQVFACTQ